MARDAGGWATGEDARRRVGAFWAILKRVEANKDYFEQVWELQPRCMTIFGDSVEATFMLLHQARRNVEVAAEMLAEEAACPPLGAHASHTDDLYKQLRVDLNGHGEFTKEGDRIGKMLERFRGELKALCQPMIDEEYGQQKLSWLRRKGSEKSGKAVTKES